MIRRPPRSTRTDTLFPYTTLFRTTTSSMLAWILEHAGRKPNFLIGGIAADLQVSARYEAGRDVFVIEADEYDTAFFDKRSQLVHYRPRPPILNNKPDEPRVGKAGDSTISSWCARYHEKKK